MDDDKLALLRATMRGENSPSSAKRGVARVSGVTGVAGYTSKPQQLHRLHPVTPKKRKREKSVIDGVTEGVASPPSGDASKIVMTIPAGPDPWATAREINRGGTLGTSEPALEPSRSDLAVTPLYDPERLQREADSRNREAASRGRRIGFAAAADWRNSPGLTTLGAKSGAASSARRRGAEHEPPSGFSLTAARAKPSALNFAARNIPRHSQNSQDGRLAEIFIDASKPSNDAADDARDAAVAMSIALQHGTPLEAIRAALTRDGPPGSWGPLLMRSREQARPQMTNILGNRHWREGRACAALAHRRAA